MYDIRQLFNSHTLYINTIKIQASNIHTFSVNEHKKHLNFIKYEINYVDINYMIIKLIYLMKH